MYMHTLIFTIIVNDCDCGVSVGSSLDCCVIGGDSDCKVLISFHNPVIGDWNVDTDSTVIRSEGQISFSRSVVLGICTSKPFSLWNQFPAALV